MPQLKRFDTESGIELVIDTQTGESFATVSSYARMSQRDKSTISRRLQRVTNGTRTESEIMTPGGIQGVVLINEDLIAEWLPKDNPELATKMMTAGVRVYNHTLAGFKISSTAPEPSFEEVEELTKDLGDEIDIYSPATRQLLQIMLQFCEIGMKPVAEWIARKMGIVS